MTKGQVKGASAIVNIYNLQSMDLYEWTFRLVFLVMWHLG
jgi:hypothetical protein